MTTPPLHLTASAAPAEPMHLEAAAPAVEAPPAVDTTRRLIRGHFAVWGQYGNASVGPCTFVQGSVELPTDLGRVKLLIDHDHARPVGYMLSYAETAIGLEGTFYVPEGEAGDEALAKAGNGLRDALSPGAYVTGYSFDQHERLIVEASTLNEVSLVTIPAFADARVSEVKARHTQGETHMRRRTTTGTGDNGAAVTPGSSAAPEAAPAAPVTVEAAAATPPPAAPAASSPAPAGAAPSSPLELEAAHVARVVEAVRELARPTAARGGRRAGLDLRAMSAITATHLRNGGAAAQLPMVLEAALTDVTPPSLAGEDGEYGPQRPQYVDDLFELADVARPTFDAFRSSRPLRSLKLHGWVWETRPAVARYDGNKAEVPSNSPKKKRLEADAQRFAGAWDIDRVFIDLPGPDGSDEIADILVEATRDYLRESEEWAAELVAAASTPLYGAAVTVPAALAVIGSYFAQIKGSRIGYVAMGADAWSDFANMTNDEAPWWLRNLGGIDLGEAEGNAGGLKFRLDGALEPTEVLAADTRAVDLREVDPPIRVQALDVAKGGVDVGVFGYAAALPTETRLIVNLDTAGREAPVEG